MAIHVVTSNPSGLLAAIKKAIDDKKIDTWEYDEDGDFTHSPPQWRRQAWLRPVVSQGTLMFGIVAPKDTKLSTVVYAVYHGRYIEMLLSHFDSSFSIAQATAQLQHPDLYK